MKKFVVAVAIVVLLLSAQVSQAADLQEGWYVKLAAVALYGFDYGINFYTGTAWHFTGELGEHGPFTVTSPDPVWAERTIAVNETVSGIAPYTSVYLWGEPENPVTYDVTEIGLFWETDYDAASMRLELLSYDGFDFTLLWSQDKSGFNSGYHNVLSAWQQIPVGSVPVFRVTAIPEPSSLLALFGYFGAIALMHRRRS